MASSCHCVLSKDATGPVNRPAALRACFKKLLNPFDQSPHLNGGIVMKKILFLALALTASLSAYAQEAVVAPEAVRYAYGMHLDVAKVIHITPTADVCGPTPVQMTYRDLHGEIHILEYNVIGSGCTN
jgi:hypothetical protein